MLKAQLVHKARKARKDQEDHRGLQEFKDLPGHLALEEQPVLKVELVYKVPQDFKVHKDRPGQQEKPEYKVEEALRA